MRLRFTRSAEALIEDVLLDSAERYGDDAAARYAELIRAALDRIAERGDPPGAAPVADLPAVRAYALRLARVRVPLARRVANPRHIVVYRRLGEDEIEVLGIVHDRMVLARAAKRLANDRGEP